MKRPSSWSEFHDGRADVSSVVAITSKLLDSLVTNAPPKDREVEAQRKRERAAKRFATA